MNKLLLVYILLPLVAVCVSAVDLCSELECGTANSSDACDRLSCPLPKNLAAPMNSTSSSSKTTGQSKNTAPSNTMWPPYPAEPYPWDFPAGPGMPFPFQMGYDPMGPFPNFQGGYPAEYPPFQYPFY